MESQTCSESTLTIVWKHMFSLNFRLKHLPLGRKTCIICYVQLKAGVLYQCQSSWEYIFNGIWQASIHLELHQSKEISLSLPDGSGWKDKLSRALWCTLLLQYLLQHLWVAKYLSQLGHHLNEWKIKGSYCRNSKLISLFNDTFCRVIFCSK